VDCSELVQEKDKWRDILIEVKNVRAPRNGGISLPEGLTHVITAVYRGASPSTQLRQDKIAIFHDLPSSPPQLHSHPTLRAAMLLC